MGSFFECLGPTAFLLSNFGGCLLSLALGFFLCLHSTSLQHLHLPPHGSLSDTLPPAYRITLIALPHPSGPDMLSVCRTII